MRDQYRKPVMIIACILLGLGAIAMITGIFVKDTGNWVTWVGIGLLVIAMLGNAVVILDKEDTAPAKTPVAKVEAPVAAPAKVVAAPAKAPVAAKTTATASAKAAIPAAKAATPAAKKPTTTKKA